MVKPQTLDDLIKILHQIFESDNVNVEEVQSIMEAYESKPQEWKKFAKFDQYRYYYYCCYQPFQNYLEELFFIEKSEGECYGFKIFNRHTDRTVYLFVFISIVVLLHFRNERTVWEKLRIYKLEPILLLKYNEYLSDLTMLATFECFEKL